MLYRREQSLATHVSCMCRVSGRLRGDLSGGGEAVEGGTSRQRGDATAGHGGAP